MVKIRIGGQPEEVEKVVRKIADVFEIVSISDTQKDRGKSKNVRVYVEINTVPPSEEIPSWAIIPAWVKSKKENLI